MKPGGYVKPIGWLGAIVSIAALVPTSAAAADRAAPPVTYAKDVAPILYKHCVECHRPTMFAPMSLMTYEETRPWARAIKQRVVKREMPPFSVDAPLGHFKNDPRLAQSQIDTIVAWVDAGAPKGDDRDLPPAPQFVEGWSIGEPDAIFTMTEEFQVPAEGTIPYQYIRIPTNLAEDKWIKAIEFRPGNRAVVHHIIGSVQQPGFAPTDERAPGREGLGGITPNKTGVVYEDGVARRLRKNSEIILQMHYTTTGKATSDRTSVGVIFTDEPPTRTLVSGAVLQLQFAIPPGAAHHEVRAARTLTADTLITAMTPHMHVRGKDMTYTAKYPDGRTETLLSVPKYLFDWQSTYELKEPKLLPKGTIIEVVAHYDNSAGNPYNPDPTQTVRWGDQTWEEMMIGFYTEVVPTPAAGTTAQQ